MAREESREVDVACDVAREADRQTREAAKAEEKRAREEAKNSLATKATKWLAEVNADFTAIRDLLKLVAGSVKLSEGLRNEWKKTFTAFRTSLKDSQKKMEAIRDGENNDAGALDRAEQAVKDFHVQKIAFEMVCKAINN